MSTPTKRLISGKTANQCRALAVLVCASILVLPGATDAQTESLPTVSVFDARAIEGDAIEFTVSLSAQSSVPVTVQYSTMSGTARRGTDFTEASRTLTFSQGDQNKTVTVSTIETTNASGGSVAEDDEFFYLILSDPTNATLAVPRATGAIRDDDGGTWQDGVWQVGIVPERHHSAIEGNEIEFTVWIAGGTAENLPATVQYATSSVSAESGTDFTAASGTLTFGANDTVKTVRVSTTDDTLNEGNEQFRLTLSNPTNARLQGRHDTAMGIIVNDDIPTVSVSDASATEGEAVEFTLSLSGEAGPGQTSVSYEFEYGTADDSDFTSLRSGSIGFRRGESSATVRARTTDDTIDEENETFSIRLHGPWSLHLGDATATGTIIDNDGGSPTVSVSDASATEGEAVEFTVSLSAASAQQVTVQYATSDGTAESATDFTAASGTLTFAANETSKTVSVATAEDSDGEGNETFTLTLSSPTNGTLGDATATGTIVDDDGSLPTISVSDASATEGDAVGFTVSLSAASGEQVTVQYATSDGTAESATDFTAASGTLTFAANETSKTVSVATAEDSDGEENETFTLTLSSPTNGTLGDATATGTIVDDDGSLPTISVSDASATEGDAVGFTVSLSAASGEQVTVQYATSDGTAESATDFTAASGTLTFAANETSKTVSVATAEDSDGEENETFTLTLSSPTNGTLGDATATGTIVDDDGSLPTISVSDASATEGDAVEFTVSLSAASTQTVSVSFVAHVGTDDTATTDDFVDWPPGSLVIAAGGTSGTVRVRTTDDTYDEEDETFTLTLSSPTNGMLGDATATGTIIDDDAGSSLPTLSVSDASATESNALEFTVSLSAPSDEQVTVQYATSDGTAESASDFTAASGTLTFGANETSKTVSVATAEDSADEENETFTLTLSSPTNATLGDGTATGTINDDDDASPALTASFENMPSSHDGVNAFTFGLTFSEELSLSYRTLRDDAFNVTGGAVREARRKQQGSNLQWTIAVEPNSNGAVTIELPATQDCNASGAICTDDSRPLSRSLSAMVAGPDPSLSVSDASATEGDAVEFTVSLSAASAQQVTVQYATSAGTAESGTDFTAASGTLTFGANERSKSVSVATAEDSDDEEDETFTLTLSSPTNASLGDATATGTITDDDESLPTVSVTDASATEGDAVEFTVSLSAASTQQVTVQYATSAGTAESGTDFTAASGTLTFGANERSKSVSVATAEDSDDEEDETFTLTLSSPTNASLGDATATGTITDDDESLPTVSVTDASATEGDAVEFTVSLSAASAEQVTVQYATSSGTAESGTDFAAASATLTFGANETSKSVSVSTMQDSADEENETFTLTLSSPTNGTLGDAMATGTIVDDDESPTISVSDASATEGDAVEFTVSLSAASAQTVSVSFVAHVGTGDTATTDDFVDWPPGSLIIAPGGTSGTVRVRTTEDSDDEEDETFTLTLSSPTNATLGDATATGTILDDDAAPLSASFSDMPREHTGELFAFGLTFSEEFPLSYRTLRDEAFDVMGGVVRKARRLQQNSNLAWTIHVEPDSHGAVTVVLPQTTNCNASGAICTGDDRPLSHSLAATVAGPLGISVADASVEEAAGASLAFVVTLSRAASGTVTVDYSTADGSAQAGVDYTAATGTLSFHAGESSKTIPVAVLDDAHDEGEETLTLTLSNVSGGRLTDSEATGTIKNRDPLPRALLARFGRTAAVHVVEQVEERIAAPREPGIDGRFAGREMRPGMEQDFSRSLLGQFSAPAVGANALGTAFQGPMSGGPLGGAASLGMPALGGGIGMAAAAGPTMGGMAGPGVMMNGGGLFQMGFGDGDVLTGSAISLNRETRQGGILSFWSRGARSYFSGQEGALSLGGDVRTTMFGADYAKGPLVAGLSLSHSRGLGEYAGVAGGQVASAVTGLYPWLGYKATDRVTVWGVAGYGAGGMLLTPDGGPALESGLSMAMAAAGTRGELVAGGAGGFELAFKADALWVGTSIDGVDGPAGRLKATEAAVTRFRTGLEGSRDYTLGGRLALTSSVEVGLRHDGGDAENGAGMDIGGGLVVSDSSTGLAVDVRVRMLVVHQAEGFRERGMAVSFSYNPTPSTPLGFAARVAPSWGGQAAGGAEALWGRESMAGMAHGGFASGNRLDGEVGYGLPVGSRLVGTPRVGFSTSEHGRDYRVGYGLGVLDRERLNLELGVDAHRRESPMFGGTDNGFLGQATLGW